MALWWLNEVSAAHEQHTRAYLGYKERGDRRRAAYLAAWLAREQVFLRANVSAMHGWSARAESLLQGDRESVERGWVDVYRATMTASVEELETITLYVVDLARRFHDEDLEVFALVNAGYACIALGRVNEGMNKIDEAMTAATSGEVKGLFVITETFCVTLSACELAGDLVRTDHWCEVAVEYAQRYDCPFLSAYCRTTYGGLLVAMGRWQEAETALMAAIHAFDAGYVVLRVHAVLKLADLRVSQGRLEEAEVLLVGHEDHDSAVLPLAHLQLAQGEVQLARALLENALQLASSSPLTRAPLLRLLVDVLLAADDLENAQKVADELIKVAQQIGSHILIAQANLALGQLKRFAGEANAVDFFHTALEHLRAFEQSLLAGRTKLELTRTLQKGDPAAAIMWARAALALSELARPMIWTRLHRF
jgi:tetratricopeptide (TPR) repeat protein